MTDRNDKQLAPKNRREAEEDEWDDSIVSGTECTGLIPTPPESEPEAEAYTDLYAVPRPADKPVKSTRQSTS